MASCFGRKKLFPTIKDVDEILTVELLEAAIGMTEIVGKYLTEVEQTRAQRVTDSPLHVRNEWFLRFGERIRPFSKFCTQRICHIFFYFKKIQQL